MAERKTNAGLLILAGIGVGVLAGVTVGLVLSYRRHGDGTVDIAETVDDLRDKAERVLNELAGSITDLTEKAERIAADVASVVEAVGDSGGI